MQRREFITLLSGAVAMSPFAASAQQARVYTLGVLTLPYLTLPYRTQSRSLRHSARACATRVTSRASIRLEIRSAPGRPDLQAGPL
jgi:hypothetical protein